LTRISCHARRFVRDRVFPFVSFSIRFSHFFGYVEALIDTGSPFTVLSTTDALKLKLPIASMRKGETVLLAGFRFLNVPIQNVRLMFRTENAKSLSIEIPRLGVLIPTKIDKQMLEDVKHIPSIIGNDFLEDHNFILYFNPSVRIAYLEREDAP